jgi:hypothetical protein
MARQSKTIGERSFRSATEAKDYYRQILNSGHVGRTLTELEFAALMDLLSLHPRSVDKIGNGVRAFTIELNEYKKRAFFLHRVDGSKEDFSYLKCISGDHNPFTEFSKACRRSLENRLRAWKVSQMDGNVTKCAITGKTIAIDQAHIDHKPPLTFSVIVKSFVVARNIDLSTVKYVRKNINGVELEDVNLASDFDKFHSQMAVLRIVYAVENLKGSSAARITPTAKDHTL